MLDRSKLTSKLISNRDTREAYVRSKLNVLIPAQIRGLRLRREMTQQQLGIEADMLQARISAMESPGEASFNLETLVRIASAFRVGLKVEFVPYSEMLTWENAFSQDSFNVVPVEKDDRFISPKIHTQGYYSSAQQQELGLFIVGQISIAQPGSDHGSHFVAEHSPVPIDVSKLPSVTKYPEFPAIAEAV